jgi:putative phage-type endonuclease
MSRREINSFEQGSREWLEWREAGIGASDVPVVLGISPFKSRFQLWAEKAKLVKPAPFHPAAVKAMARGTLLEPEIRAWYERTTGRSIQPRTVVHPDYPCIRASLDGQSGDGRVIEIKAPGKTDHTAAKKGNVPKKYLAQVQIQMECAGLEVADYVSHDGSRDLETGQLSDAGGVIIEVAADPEYQKRIVEACLEFWTLVQERRPPSVDMTDMFAMVERLKQQQEDLAQTVALIDTLTNALGMEE